MATEIKPMWEPVPLGTYRALTAFHDGMALRSVELHQSQQFLAGLFTASRPPEGLSGDDCGLVSGDFKFESDRSLNLTGCHVRLDTGLAVCFLPPARIAISDQVAYADVVCGLNESSTPVWGCIVYDATGKPSGQLALQTEIGRFRVYVGTAKPKDTVYPEIANIQHAFRTVRPFKAVEELHQSAERIRAVARVFGFPLSEEDAESALDADPAPLAFTRSGIATSRRLAQAVAVEQLVPLLEATTSGNPPPVSLRRVLAAAAPLLGSGESGERATLETRHLDPLALVTKLQSALHRLEWSSGGYFAALNAILRTVVEIRTSPEIVVSRETAVKEEGLDAKSVYLVLLRLVTPSDPKDPAKPAAVSFNKAGGGANDTSPFYPVPGTQWQFGAVYQVTGFEISQPCRHAIRIRLNATNVTGGMVLAARLKSGLPPTKR